MSTFANRHNNSASAPMSESDTDDDNEQNSSFNQQNESMMHKVKDVVSKLLHPSFLFSASADTTRPKRKRTPSIEENGKEKQSEITTISNKTTVNGHATTFKLKNHRQPITSDEPQLTDDEDNSGRDVSPPEQDLIEVEQQKKRRRTANYQHVISTTTNGNHEDERTTHPLTSTNNVRSSSSRQITDNGLSTTNTTPVLLQTSTDQYHNEGLNRLTSSKQNFNISSFNRGLTPNYDPSQSPLFSIGVRKENETTMSPNRTTTNLKSNTNDFSANYLLATGLANRSLSTIPTMPNGQQSSSSTNRLLPNERQMFGVNYSSINSRRLPYIERLRRRTLQDCIRLNRTLDSEPLSISTIEEHTSTTASPIRKPVKASERECGIQCNISTTDGPTEPSRKIQRTFPPPDIRNEAISVPMNDKVPSTSQTESSFQTNSSITIEPIKPTNNITKPKVLGNITPFSWPKFARAQDEYSKKHAEKCRADSSSTQSSKQIVSVVPEKSNITSSAPIVSQSNVSSTISKVPIFGVSPPRPTKTVTESIWKCPSCTMEHPAQTASCSLCHGINPNYKRLSMMEPTPSVALSSTNKSPEIIIEEPTVPTRVTTIPITVQTESSSIITSTPITTAAESTFSIPPAVTTTASFTTTSTLPLFGTTSVTTKENVTTTPSITNSVPFSSITTTPLFGTPAATLDKPLATSASNLFQINTSTTPTFPSFGSVASTNTTTASSAPVSSSIIPATTLATSSSVTIPTSITFGSFSSTPIVTTTASVSLSTTISSDKPLQFSFGTSASAPSLLPSTSIPAAATTAPSITPNLFSFSSTPAVPTTTSAASLTLPVPSTTSGFSFPSGFPVASTSSAATATSAPSLFGSSLSSTSGFSFPSAGAGTTTTTTTTSSSTPFAFGASSPPKPFAPPVISSSITTLAPPAFGATASFGAAPAAVDKPSTSVPSFSGFGSTSTQSSLFTFGATSNTATNPIQTSVAPAGATSGFPFAPVSTAGTTTAAAAAPPPSAFGSAAPSFAFGSAPSFSFGSTSTAPPSNTPFQFSGGSASTANNTFSTSFSTTSSVSVPENNPFSVVGEDTGRRPVIKAKRRAKP